MVYFFCGEGERLGGASHNAKVASLASVFVYDDGSFYFAHSVKVGFVI